MTQENNNKKVRSLVSIAAGFVLLSASCTNAGMPSALHENFSPFLGGAKSGEVAHSNGASSIGHLPAQQVSHLHPFFPGNIVKISAGAAHTPDPIKVNFGQGTSVPKTKAKQTNRDGVFGSVAIGFGKLPTINRLKAITQTAQLALNHCLDGRCSDKQLLLEKDIKALQAQPLKIQVTSVNKLVNNYVAYRRDSENYGRSDYWASAAETLNRGSGDCEDYAILKMATLENLGVPSSSMSVVILRDDRRGLFHAVLTVRTTEGIFVLDNVRQNVLLDKEIAHYTPLYSISAGRGYIHGRRATDGRTAMNIGSFNNIAPGEGP